ncbi:MAG: RND family efflux transporter MFP subunit [Oleispira sp.]|jgi:RND family efflux transporter MFP subunit
MSANLILLITAAMVFNLTSLNANSQSEPSQTGTLLTQLESRPNYITLEAKLEAIKQSTLSAQTQGIIERVNFDVNDKVEAGQLLILINSSQQKAALSQAKAALAQAQALNSDAQTILKRNRSLLTKRTLSQGEFDSSLARADSSKAAVSAAEAFVKQAMEQVSYTRITAPYSGIVRKRFIQIGELVNPGQPLMTGFALQPLRAVVDVPQSLASNLSKQDESIQILAHGKRYQGTQLTLFPYADNRYSSIRARINLAETEEENALIPGTWVQVQLPSAAQQGIFLPTSAVIQQGEVASIYIKHQDAFKLRYVRLGQVQRDNHVRILSGLEVGEQVAIDALIAIKATAKSSAAHVVKVVAE